MAYLLTQFTVADFDEWQAYFDRNDTFRTEQGQRSYRTFRSLDDSTEVVVLLEFDDPDAIRAFTGSEEWHERMAEAGVRGVPEISILEAVAEKPRQSTAA
ncbi:antibiotic biosynthesis monooxygenase [Halobium salinum]|uniref:Antibiotic biosynthesis monooxygenase n=1 Tax=Halobium salinum TaxID=1364940 RepID=A0ABD5P8L0_9EURY|nr:antibiotic biosynthesis monooxygenase [Halobium salinum]